MLFYPVYPHQPVVILLCCLLRFLQPFSILSHAQRPGNSECDVLISMCPCFGLSPEQPSLLPAFQLALPTAGYGFLFHRINSYQVLLHAGWTEAGLFGKLTRPARKDAM